MPTQLLNNQNC